jgi:hypothetical protein
MSVFGVKLAVAALSVLLILGQQSVDQSLRAADWRSVLTSDPSLTVDTQVPSVGLTGPYVRPADESTPGGFAALDSVLYSDLDGDGTEEAVILLESGGTAGVMGLLVYHADTPQPRLAATLAGYKMGARIEDGGLVVLQPQYAGFEPNCCPSSVLETHYTLADSQLVAGAQQEQPYDQAQTITVQQFYMDLDRHALADAYALLSEADQQAKPFDTWSAGYANTEHVKVDSVALGDDGVHVAITSNDSGQPPRHFAGTWTMVWGPDVHHWLLDKPKIVEVQ